MTIDLQKLINKNRIDDALPVSSATRALNPHIDFISIYNSKKISRHHHKVEENIQIALINYIRSNYPDVLIKADFAAGMKLTIGQAVRAKKLGNTRSWPDVFIAEPRSVFHGLFLELKQDGTKIFKCNGEYATDHIAAQAEMITKLRFNNYAAFFTIGFQAAQEIIDAYLSATLLDNSRMTHSILYKIE